MRRDEELEILECHLGRLSAADKDIAQSWLEDGYTVNQVAQEMSRIDEHG